MLKPLPALKNLFNAFEINGKSPSNLMWKNPSCLKLKPGDFAGGQNTSGYWAVGLQINKKTNVYMVHRVVYAMYYQTNIDSIYIDHIDGNRLNNLIDNLRIASNQQNTCNKQKQLSCTSKHKGVSWDKNCKKWRAQICVDYKKQYLGMYETEEAAALAYNAAAKHSHKQFALLNHV